MGRVSLVSIEIHYWLDVPGIEYRWGKDFPRPSRLTVGLTLPPMQWVPSLLPGGKAAGE